MLTSCESADLQQPVIDKIVSALSIKSLCKTKWQNVVLAPLKREFVSSTPVAATHELSQLLLLVLDGGPCLGLDLIRTASASASFGLCQHNNDADQTSLICAMD